MRCAVRIYTGEDATRYRQCSRRAVWFIADRDDHGVCSQHRRKTDTRRIPKDTEGAPT